MDGTKENPYAFVVYKFISVTYVISSGSKGNILFLRHRLAFEKKAIELALRKTFIVNECMRCSLRKTNNTHICNKFERNEQRKKRVYSIFCIELCHFEAACLDADLLNTPTHPIGSEIEIFQFINHMSVFLTNRYI